MDNDNIYDKIQEIFGTIPGNFSILEEQIDINLQMEYFEFSRNYKKDNNPKEIIKKKDFIFRDNLSTEDKKTLLVQLASLDNVEAYRTIEKYLKNPDNELYEWAILAFQESRMLLESKFLDENQVFISTGLGGKGSKLRYFLVLISNTGESFTEVQKKVIKNEFEITLKKYNAEIEKVNFAESFSTVLIVVPLKVSIKDTFKEAINECNQFGNFLKPNFIVTNVKVLSTKEISDFLEKQKFNNIFKE